MNRIHRVPSQCALIAVAVLAIGCSSGPGVTPSPRATPTPARTPATVDATATSGPPAIQKVPNLVYAAIDAGGTPLELELDLYLPPAQDARPVLVFLHGGGWFQGSRSDCPGETLAAASYAVACVDYRLAAEGCPAWSIFPGAVLDVRAAVSWLRDNSAEYRLDTTQIALIGDSAGAHLATLVGMSAGVPEFDRADTPSGWGQVQAVVDWYGPAGISDGPVDFTDDPCATSLAAVEERFYGAYAWALFLGGRLTDPAVVGRAKLAAPATHADAADPPVLVIHGDSDTQVPIRQSELLVERLTAAGVVVTFVRVPDRDHSYRPPDGQEGEIAPEFLDPTLRFLAEAFGPQEL